MEQGMGRKKAKTISHLPNVWTLTDSMTNSLVEALLGTVPR